MRPENVVIIGSGPAGLTAALYCARMGLSPLIIEGPLPGGQLMTTFLVENWPGEKSILGPSLMNNLREHATHLGTRFISETVTNIETSKQPFTIITKNNTRIHAQSIIIATGSTPRRIGCPGEDLYWGIGVSSCAVCDGAFYKDKTVAVIGGGNTALGHILFLSRFARQLFLIHHGTQLTATEQHLIESLKNIAHLSIFYQTKVKEIIGDTKKITELQLNSQNPEIPSKISADGVFVAIGSQATTSFLPPEIRLSEKKQIVISHTTQTSVDGIFAAGDVTIHAYRQAITAASAGCQAALDVQNYLKKNNIPVH